MSLSTRCSTLLFAAAIGAVSLLQAGTLGAEPTAFGSRTLEIPAPDGFVPVGKDVPDYLSISQAYLPAQNRLVEIYTTAEDKAAFLAASEPELARYFQLQVARGIDGKTISSAEFSQASGLMEAELEKAFGNMTEQAAELAHKGNTALQEKTGSDAKVSFGGIRYLGVFRREPWAMFFTLGSDVQISGSDVDAGESGAMISAGALALINHQIVYLYAYADDTGPEAHAWAQNAVSAWADAVNRANPSDPALEASSRAFGGFDFGRIGQGALIGGAIGLLIGLFAWLKRGR